MVYPAERSRPLEHPANLAQQLTERLATLKGEFDKGQARIHQLETELTSLRETILRISGAILVLQEILSSPTSAASAIPLEGAPTVARADFLASPENQLAAIK
jgi:chromosome segregation ATPase